MSKAAVVAALGSMLLLGGSTAFGGLNIAVIDNGNGVPFTKGEEFCMLFEDGGHVCTVFPKEGPTAPLDSFDSVVDVSHVWTDSLATLPAFLQQGKTVVLWGSSPSALGINSNPLVREWIGASGAANDTVNLNTVATDPILGDIPVGTLVGYCELCLGLLEPMTSSSAKLLGRISTHQRIGLMRNTWNGGVAVYIAGGIEPYTPNGDIIIMNAVSARAITVPALSDIGLAVFSLALLGCGTAIIRRRRRSTHG